MFISNKYLGDTFKLVSSFVIKLHNIAVSININLTDLGLPVNNIDNEDELSGWKYYMNLAGEYHISDMILLNSSEYPKLNNEVGIIFESLDDGERYILTKEILNSHPATRLKLKEQGEYYSSLISSYSKFESLIKGITYPVDINEAINAKDGSILNYNREYVDINEYSLIDSVEEELYRFLLRWDVREFTVTDNLYTSSLFMNLTTTALYKVINHRLAMVGTFEANSFHIKELFKSSFGINEDVDILTYSSRIWLYKNIKNIIRNVGKEETLDSIIENIIYPSEIEVEEILLKTKDAVLLPNNFDDVTKNFYEKDKENLYKKKHSENENVLSEISIDYVINKELETTETVLDLTTDKARYVSDEKTKIQNIKTQSERTKVLNLKFKEYLDLFNIKHIAIVVDNWFNYAFNTTSSVKTLYTSSQLVGAVSLSHKQAALLVLKMLLKATDNRDVLVHEYRTNMVLKPVTRAQVQDGTVFPDYIINPLMDLIAEIPDYTLVGNQDSLRAYTEASEDWLFKFSVFNASLNAAYHGKLNAVLEKITSQITLTLSPEPQTIDDILYETGFNGVFIDEHDPMVVVEEVTNLFTGLILDKRQSQDKILQGYTNILKALTSYTVHFIKDEIGERLSGQYSLIDSLKDVNLTRILDGSYQCLEDIQGVLSSLTDDARIFTTAISTNALSYTVVDDAIDLESEFIPQDRVIGVTNKVTVTVS